MDILKQFVIKNLQDIADKIASDTCELTQEQLQDIVKIIAHRPLSKEQACSYMHMSRSTFDSKIKENILPKGKKRSGFKELVWYEDELEECVINLRNKNEQAI